MIIRVTMKDPDTLSEAIEAAVANELSQLVGVSDDEMEGVSEIRCEKASKVAATWFKYGEYLTIEIDTIARTATVVEL